MYRRLEVCSSGFYGLYGKGLTKADDGDGIIDKLKGKFDLLSVNLVTWFTTKFKNVWKGGIF